MKTEYYIAYGSNLNMREMSLRCPTAVPVGGCTLKNWQLLFCGYATVIPLEGAQTPVAVWKIDEECEAALDEYEVYPSLYRKEYVDVTVEGRTLSAMVYLMNTDEPAMPITSSYLDIIDKGYEDFGLDKEYLVRALEYTKARLETNIPEEALS